MGDIDQKQLNRGWKQQVRRDEWGISEEHKWCRSCNLPIGLFRPRRPGLISVATEVGAQIPNAVSSPATELLWTLSAWCKTFRRASKMKLCSFNRLYNYTSILLLLKGVLSRQGNEWCWKRVVSLLVVYSLRLFLCWLVLCFVDSMDHMKPEA